MINFGNLSRRTYKKKEKACNLSNQNIFDSYFRPMSIHTPNKLFDSQLLFTSLANIGLQY